MRINRYRWTPKGMVYDPTGEWMGAAAHEAVVSFHETERSQLINTNHTQTKSLEDGVNAKVDELNVAKKRIEDLEKLAPATPTEPLDPLKGK